MNAAAPTDRFLALDAGNSSVKAAVWDGTRWSEVVRFDYDAGADEWAGRIRALVPHGTPAGLASVVPQHTEALAAGVTAATGGAPIRISARLPLPFEMAYRTPETLGADRIAVSVAAFGLGGGRPIIALDAGTAVTVDVVDVRGGAPVYLGGAIAPGPDLLALALARGTGALPRIPFGGTLLTVGDSTSECIRTGVAAFLGAGVQRLVADAAAVLASSPFVVATGGVAPWLVAHGVAIDALVPTLVLDGVRALCISTDAAASPRRG
ncbi:MAG TPA: type III pantothenate kinase [Rubricoccaceae bacterium]